MLLIARMQLNCQGRVKYKNSIIIPKCHASCQCWGKWCTDLHRFMLLINFAKDFFSFCKCFTLCEITLWQSLLFFNKQINIDKISAILSSVNILPYGSSVQLTLHCFAFLCLQSIEEKGHGGWVELVSVYSQFCFSFSENIRCIHDGSQKAHNYWLIHERKEDLKAN